MKSITEKLTKWQMYRIQLSFMERSTDILHRLEPSWLENTNKTEMKLSSNYNFPVDKYNFRKVN